MGNQPARRVGAEGGAAEDVDAEDALEEERKAPLRAVVMEKKAIVHPVSQPVGLYVSLVSSPELAFETHINPPSIVVNCTQTFQPLATWELISD